MPVYTDVISELQKWANPQKAQHSMRFFKTGPGQYGEGDRFIGVTVPEQRAVAKKFKDLDLMDLQKLLRSDIHELRLTALIILVDQYKKADTSLQKRIYAFYLKNTKYINNWDLVDSSAPGIVGAYVYEYPDALPVLYTFVQSRLLWERRIAMLATFAFIKAGELDIVFEIAELLRNDTEDLMHKAVGWMLREAGKRDENRLKSFLDTHAAYMPRTMLRYAIERFDPAQRAKYLKKQ